MIIDLILDRKDGLMSYIENGKLITYTEYSPKKFYNEVIQYGEIGWDIAAALDSGEEEDVKRTLCDYIKEEEYRLSICDYIKSVNWL